MSVSDRRRMETVYYMVLDYYHAKQRAAGLDAPQTTLLTDRPF